MATIPQVAIIERVDLREAVTAELRDLILGGELEPGQRLIETELADRFGTSRGPVRDALMGLEQSGLVTSVARRGTFVVDLTADDIVELYSLRSVLEVLAVERAAERVTAADIDRLQSILGRLTIALDAGDGRRTGEADMSFHRAIVHLADHGRLAESWNRLSDQVVLLMCRLSSVKPDLQERAGGHGAIFEALEAGDGATAAELTRDHLERACTALVDALHTGA